MGRLYGCITRLVVVLAVLVGAVAFGAGSVSIEGKVVDFDGAPIAGAKVTLYSMSYSQVIFNYEIESTQSVTSDDDGGYVFKVADSSGRSTSKILIAEKEGLAIGWANWYPNRDAPSDIKLVPAGKIGGTVVDEAGNPIGGADVRVVVAVEKGERSNYLLRVSDLDFLVTKTGKQGGFEFGKLPGDAAVIFQISKAGKGTVLTYDEEASGMDAYQYSVGQTDIKITLVAESVIEGKVIDKASQKPVEGIRLQAMLPRRQYTGKEPVRSAADGSFRIEALAAGEHTLRIVFKDDQLAPWIAEETKVELASGDSKKDVVVELQKGGVVEIAVTAEDGGDAVEKAQVSILRKEPRKYFSGYSDEEGKARLRLLPGDYSLQGAYKTGMTGAGSQEFVIEEGKTTALSISMTGLPKVSGQVLDPDGKPLAGAQVLVKPAGHQSVKSDDEGRYEARWDPRHWNSSDTSFCLVARHEEKNLAFSEIMDGDTETITARMETGWIVFGAIVDPEGKPIKGANPMLMLNISNWGSSLSSGGTLKTDAQGKFTIRALPPDRDYSLYARGDGYGQKRISVKADQFEEGRLDMGAIEIPVANLSVRGKVVDLEGKPVKGAHVYGHGEGQPDIHNITTNAEGEFVVKAVCEGRIRLSANSSSGNNMYGSIQTEGGAEDVTIVIGERSSSGRFVPRQPAPLKGKALPDTADLGLELDGDSLEGKPVVLCFWDMNQRPSRHFVKQLAARAESLPQSCVVLLVETSSSGKEKVGEWMNKYDASLPCGIPEKDFSQIKFGWSVKGLPWLIVTDAEHVVRSEGISLAQLEDEFPKTSN